MNRENDGRRRKRNRMQGASDGRNSLLIAAIAMALGTTQGARAVEDSGNSKAAGGPLEEIVVTATRRNSSVVDVPYNISAVSGAQLDAARITDLNSIARIVPGLQTTDVGARAASTNSNFIIRGLNTYDPGASFVAPNLTVPLVSTYIDDVPLFTNIQFNDIQRIEVLRGPQGTLYGSGSVGGTVRVIHNPPDTEHSEFEITASADHTDHASNSNYNTQLVFNLPISDRVAWRVSAGYEKQAGFIHADAAVLYGPGLQPVLADPANPLTSNYATTKISDINGSSSWSIRNALLWKISNSVSAEFAYYHENERANGFDFQSQGEPDYTTSIQIPVQPIDRNVDLAALTVTADAGFATLTSSSSWYRNEYHDLFDEPPSFVPTFQGFYSGYPRSSIFNFDRSLDRSFVEELRLVSKDTGPWDWIAGAYFREQHQYITDPEYLAGFHAWSLLPGSAASAETYYGLPVGTYGTQANLIHAYNGGLPASQQTDFIYNFTRNAYYREYANFGELSFKITPAWQVTAGGRVFWEHFSQNVIDELPVCAAFCAQDGVNPDGINGASAGKSFHHQIFKFNTSYKLDADMNAYATVAEGYRHGGANALCQTPNGSPLCYSTAAAAPLIPYRSDTAINYEVGLKGSAFDHRLQYSTALFRIDWKDIQLETFSVVTGTTLIENGKTARSQGLEAEATAEIVAGLTATASYAYNDAKLTEGFVSSEFVGFNGDRLPAVAKNTVSLSVDYFQPLTAVKGLRYHLDATYKGDVATAINDCNVKQGTVYCPGIANSFGRTPNFTSLDGYAVFNGSIALLLSEQWEFRLYGSNLANKLAITSASVGAPPGDERDNLQFVTRPRTFGVEAHYRFK